MGLGRAWDSAFLMSSQPMLLLLVPLVPLRAVLDSGPTAHPQPCAEENFLNLAWGHQAC